MLRLPISERGKIDRDSEKILDQRMSFERMDDKFLRGAIKLLVDDLNQTRYHLKHFPATDTSCQQCIRTSDPWLFRRSLTPSRVIFWESQLAYMVWSTSTCPAGIMWLACQDRIDRPSLSHIMLNNEVVGFCHFRLCEMPLGSSQNASIISGGTEPFLPTTWTISLQTTSFTPANSLTRSNRSTRCSLSLIMISDLKSIDERPMLLPTETISLIFNSDFAIGSVNPLWVAICKSKRLCPTPFMSTWYPYSKRCFSNNPRLFFTMATEIPSWVAICALEEGEGTRCWEVPPLGSRSIFSISLSKACQVCGQENGLIWSCSWDVKEHCIVCHLKGQAELTIIRH